jgi:hypothetical protein
MADRSVGIITLGAGKSRLLTDLGSLGLSGSIGGTSGSRTVGGDLGASALDVPDTTAGVVVSASTTDRISRGLRPTDVTVQITDTFHGGLGTTIRGTSDCLGVAVVLHALTATVPGIMGIMPEDIVVETHGALASTLGGVEGRSAGARNSDAFGGAADGAGAISGEDTRACSALITGHILRVGLETSVTVEGAPLINVRSRAAIRRVSNGGSRTVVLDLTASRSRTVFTNSRTSRGT